MAEKPQLLGPNRINSTRWDLQPPSFARPDKMGRNNWVEVVPQNFVNSQVSSLCYVFKMDSD